MARIAKNTPATRTARTSGGKVVQIKTGVGRRVLAAEERAAEAKAIVAKSTPVKTAKAPAAPPVSEAKWGTLKTHGNPDQVWHYGANPAAPSDAPRLLQKDKRGGIAGHGVAHRFWGAPVRSPQASPAKAAPAKRGGPRITKAEYKIPAGYIMKYPHPSYDLLKKTDASVGGPAWLIVCTRHGVTEKNGAAKATEGDKIGSVAQRPTWCPGCKADAKA